MAILAGSGANADVAEESAMHPIIEAEIMMTRTRPRRTDNPLRGERAVAGLVLADASRRLG